MSIVVRSWLYLVAADRMQSLAGGTQEHEKEIPDLPGPSHVPAYGKTAISFDWLDQLSGNAVGNQPGHLWGDEVDADSDNPSRDEICLISLCHWL